MSSNGSGLICTRLKYSLVETYIQGSGSLLLISTGIYIQRRRSGVSQQIDHGDGFMKAILHN